MIRILNRSQAVDEPTRPMHPSRPDLRTRLGLLLLAASLLAGTTALAGCRSSARDEYLATRNIRIAPTESGDEPGSSPAERSGVAGVDEREPASDPR